MVGMRGRLELFLEGVVILAILLVLVQTLLQDLALVAGWSWPVRKKLILIGFGFDIFFTLEFLIRFYHALLERRAWHYLSRERGWIDLLASVPLLLLNSGPAAAAILLGSGGAGGIGGLWNVLKVAKAIRVTRILRLLRLLKVFKQIRYIGSPMLQRHVAKITTLTVTTMVAVLFFWTLGENLLQSGTTEELLAEQRAAAVQRMLAAEGEAQLQRRAEKTPDLLLIKRAGTPLYSRLSNHEYRRFFGPQDYLVTEHGEYRFFFNLLPRRAEFAGVNLLFFLLILAIVLVLLLLYAPHFALTVTDPIHIMRRGFREPSYRLEVRIPPEYAGDDIYRLARHYNEHYLPMKERARPDESARSSTDLTIDDIDALFGKK